MKKKLSLPVAIQFFLSHTILIVVFGIGLVLVNIDYSGMLRGVVSENAMQEMVKSADMFELRLKKLQNTAYAIAKDDGIADISAARQLSIDDYAQIYPLSQRIMGNYKSNNFVDSMIIWFDNSSSVWNNGVFLDSLLAQAAGQSFRIDNQPFAEFFRDFVAQGGHNTLRSVSVQNSIDIRRMFLLCINLSALSGRKINAWIAFFLSENQTDALFSFSQYIEAGGSFGIFNSADTAIWQTGTDARVGWNANKDAAARVTLRENQNTQLFYQPADGAFRYRLIVPSSYLSELVMKGQMTSIMVALTALAAALALATLLAWKSAKPVRGLLSITPHSNARRNEYETLYESLYQLLQDRSLVKENLRKQTEMRRHTVFSELFIYGFRSEDSLLEALAQVEILPEACAHTAVYVHLSLQEENDEIPAHMILNEMLASALPRMLHSYPISSRAYAVICPMRDNEDMTDLKARLEKVSSDIRQQYKIIVTCVIGPPRALLLETPDSLQRARRTYIGMELSSHGQTVLATPEMEYTENTWRMTEAMRKQLINLCRSGEDDILEKTLAHFFREQSGVCMPSRLELMQLGFDFRSLLYELQCQIPAVSLAPLSMEANALPHAQDARRLQRDALLLMQSICRQVSSWQSDSARRVYSDVKEYIQRQFKDRDLSLTSIAEHFNISEKYLSQLYKKVGGVNLTSEIENIRLTQVIARMKDPAQSLAEICTDCGYGSLNSFYKAFKRVYAVSPSQYRKDMMAHGEDPDICGTS